MSESQIRIVQVKSSIGTKPKHKGALRALGLGRIGNEKIMPDNKHTRGMIARVPHLISITEV